MERWIESGAVEARASNYPLLPMRDVLDQRNEAVQVDGRLGDWQAITIKFSGEVLPRERTEAFKGAMFAAYPGDLAFSKIDARNGAVGLIPADIPKAVVTSEYPVFTPKSGKLRADFLHHLLRAEHFKADLQRKASGTSGRKRVTAEGFLSLEVPVPSLAAQGTLVAAYSAALASAAKLEQEAKALERSGWRAFEDALGVAPLPPLLDRPIFVARFKNVERWSHENMQRATMSGSAHHHSWPLARLGDVVVDLENGWSPKCHDHPARQGKWGVLKLGAVSFGTFNASENKELPASLKPRPECEVEIGDVLISRANVVRYVGACAYVGSTPSKLMLCDKIFRVRFRDEGRLLPRFLAEAMKLQAVREHIEARLTGTSPTMKNISKPALLDICFPLPPMKVQRQLVVRLLCVRRKAADIRKRSKTIRSSAWAAFESALFAAAE